MSAQEATSDIKPFLFINHHSDLRMVRFSGSTVESATQVLLHGIKVCEIWDHKSRLKIRNHTDGIMNQSRNLG